MEKRLSILFYGKKTKQDSNKTLSIYLRATIEGQRFEVSTQRYVEVSKWSVEACKMKGNTEEARSLNHYLDNLKQKVYSYQKSINEDGEVFTKETLRLKWYGIKEKSYTLIEEFRHHNQQLELLIGKENSKATFGKYRTTLDHTISFLKWKFQRSDIELPSIGFRFLKRKKYQCVNKPKLNLLNKYIEHLANKHYKGSHCCSGIEWI
jgi:hypothetical protein